MSMIETPKDNAATAMERVLVVGDLAKLSTEERVQYYGMVCNSVGLNPLTRPFEYITLNGKLTLYARKDATDQLRQLHNLSVQIVSRELVGDDCYVVTARATNPGGRCDESIGAVNVGKLTGEAKCNAMMRAETKAKRRVTLSFCGLGLLDETEIETIPSAKPEVERIKEPIQIAPPVSAAPRIVADLTPEPVVEPAPKPEPPKLVSKALAGKLHMRFREELREDLRSAADEMLSEFLAKRGFVDAAGRGSAAAVTVADYATVGIEAVKWAKSL